MEVNNIRSILSNKFHEAQSIMDKKEKVLNVVSKGIKATASTPWAKKYKKDIDKCRTGTKWGIPFIYL